MGTEETTLENFDKIIPDKVVAMPRAKKESVLISARIEKATFERLEKFCEDSGLGKTVTLEKALNMYMDEYYGKQELQM